MDTISSPQTPSHDRKINPAGFRAALIRRFIRCFGPISLIVITLVLFVAPVHAVKEFGNGQVAELALGDSRSGLNLNTPAALAVDQLTGKLFVADSFQNRVLRYSGVAAFSSGQPPEAVFGKPNVFDTTEPAIVAADTLKFPAGLVLEGDSLWVSDSGNQRILRYTNALTAPSGASAVQVLGQPDFTSSERRPISSREVAMPEGLAVEANGDLWVADRFYGRVVRFADAAHSGNYPFASQVLGKMNFTDQESSPERTASSLWEPVSLAVSGRTLFVADSAGRRILRWNVAGALVNGATASRVLGASDFTQSAPDLDSASTWSQTTTGMVLDASDRLYLCLPDRVMRWDNALTKENGAPANAVLLVPSPTTPARIGSPEYYRSIAIFANFHMFISVDRIVRRYENPAGSSGNMVRVSEVGWVSSDLASANTTAEPGGICVDRVSGKVFIADTVNHRVLRFRNSRKFSRGANDYGRNSGEAAEWVIGQADFTSHVTGAAGATSLRSPTALHLAPDGTLYVADTGNNRVLRFPDAVTRVDALPACDTAGIFGQTNAAGSAASVAGLSSPQGLTLDSKGALWVADTLNHRVLRFDGAASAAPERTPDLVLGQPDFLTTLVSKAGNGLNRPTDVDVDATGRVWVCDAPNRVLRWDAPSTNGQTANGVIGKAGVEDTLEYDTGHYGLLGVAGLTFLDDGTLALADAAWSRVFLYSAAALTGGTPIIPDRVLGQRSFFTEAETVQAAGGTPADRTSRPVCLATDADGGLWVGDTGLKYCLRFTPAYVDTDNDGYLDGNETYHGTSPVDASSRPVTMERGSYGMDFPGRQRIGGGGYALLNFNQPAGLVPQANWKPGTFASYAFPNPMVDWSEDYQSLRTHDLSQLFTGENAPTPNGGNSIIMHGYLDTNETTQTTIEHWNVPYATYDVIVYCDGEGPPSMGRYTVTSNSHTESRNVFDNLDWPIFNNTGSFQLCRSNNEPGNVAVFKGHSGGHVVIKARAANPGEPGAHAAVNAIQIVSTTGEMEITAFSTNSTNGRYDITWRSLPSHSYLVESSADLVNWATEAAGIPAGPLHFQTSYGNTARTPGRRFFRVTEQ